MKELNKLRLLAGIPIDGTIEKTLKEAREVPSRREHLTQKNEKTMSARVKGVQSAIAHVKQAIAVLEKIPAVNYAGDVQHYIQELEYVLKGDDTTPGGLEQLANTYSKEARSHVRFENAKRREEEEEEAKLASMEENDDLENDDLENDDLEDGDLENDDLTRDDPDMDYHDDESDLDWESSEKQDNDWEEKTRKYIDRKMGSEEQEFVDIDYDKNGKIETSSKEHRGAVDRAIKRAVKRAVTRESIEESWYSVSTKNGYGFGVQASSMSEARKKAKEKMSSGHEIKDIQVDDYLNNAYAELRAKMANTVKNAPLTKEVESLRKGYLRKIEQASDTDLHALYNKIKKDLTISDSDVQAKLEQLKKKQTSIKEDVQYYYQNKGSDSKAANDKDESPNQLDALGDQSDSEMKDKVKVPNGVKQALKTEIEEARKEAKKMGSGNRDAKTFYEILANAFEELLGHLEKGTVHDIKKAQVFWSTLMGPIMHKVPKVVSDFIVNGGQTRSLQSRMKEIK